MFIKQSSAIILLLFTASSIGSAILPRTSCIYGSNPTCYSPYTHNCDYTGSVTCHHKFLHMDCYCNVKGEALGCDNCWSCWNISFVKRSPQSPPRSGNLYQTVYMEGTYVPLSWTSFSQMQLNSTTHTNFCCRVITGMIPVLCTGLWKDLRHSAFVYTACLIRLSLLPLIAVVSRRSFISAD